MSSDSGKTKISNLFSSKMAGGEEPGATQGMDDGGSYGGGGGSISTQEPGTFVGGGSDVQAPFSSEFKSDLASQFSMDMSGVSGVSQFLRDSARGETIRNIAIVVGVIAVFGGAFLLLKPSSDDSSSSMISDIYDDDSGYDESSDDSADSSESDGYDDGYGDDSEDSDSYSADDTDDFYDDSSDGYDEDSSSIVSGDIQLLAPLDGQRRNYDETSEYAVFEWSGGQGGTISFSRQQSMDPLEKKVTVSGNSYALAHPWPGVWYWQVENDAGVSEVSRFHVDAAQKRNIQLMPVGSLAGTGGVVSWQGDSKVARYQVELSQSGWSNPAWRFQTSSTSLALSNVTAGNYKLRVGAFSEVAGRWEYTTPVDVTVE